MKRPYLTVLTAPIQSRRRRAYRALRRALRRLLKPHSLLPPVSRYPGHYALVRSVVEGLSAIGADFNHDPRTFAGLGRIVYAPANEALRQAAGLKRQRRIDLLVAGPSNAFMPEEAGGILRMPEIDLIIVASDWVRDLYRAIAPEIFSKIRVCPAGVDAEYWKPSGVDRSSLVAVYWKSDDESFYDEVETVIKAHGLVPTRVRYGEYKTEEFRKLLDEAVLAVFVSSFETQSLALAEAWSMDVPSLVWNPRTETSWRGISFVAGSSAPYLSDITGLEWVSTADLSRALEEAVRNRAEFHPREWVLSHMTDAICSKALLKIIRDEASSA